MKKKQEQPKQAYRYAIILLDNKPVVLEIKDWFWSDSSDDRYYLICENDSEICISTSLTILTNSLEVAIKICG